MEHSLSAEELFWRRAIIMGLSMPRITRSKSSGLVLLDARRSSQYVLLERDLESLALATNAIDVCGVTGSEK